MEERNRKDNPTTGSQSIQQALNKATQGVNNLMAIRSILNEIHSSADYYNNVEMKSWFEVVKDSYEKAGVDSYTAGLTSEEINSYNEISRHNSSAGSSYRREHLYARYDADYLGADFEATNNFSAQAINRLENITKMFDAGYLNSLPDSTREEFIDEHLSDAVASKSKSAVEIAMSVNYPNGMPADVKDGITDTMKKDIQQWVIANMDDISQMPESVQNELFSDVNIKEIRMRYEKGTLEVGQEIPFASAIPLSQQESNLHNEEAKVSENVVSRDAVDSMTTTREIPETPIDVGHEFSDEFSVF
ncbi:hypothetical protein J6A31_04835 [bacterium]|nr:hypothetical protein [bacterium]